MSTQRHPRKIAATIGGVVLATGAVTGVAFAASGNDDTEDPTETEQAIPTTDLDRAEAAALAETGGGTVTETEVDDEESKYEVEVTLDDGTQVDVQLDENFTVVGTESDDR
ncbi:PepSY domain-containing protein [Promicromonospora soli]